jgi:hypothetical protein
MPRRWPVYCRRGCPRDIWGVTALDGQWCRVMIRRMILPTHRHPLSKSLMRAVFPLAPSMRYSAVRKFLDTLTAHLSLPSSLRQHRSAQNGRATRAPPHGTLRALFKTPVENRDFHGTVGAHESPFIGILRAFRRGFTCALHIYSCSAGREPVVGPSDSVNL